MAPLKTSLLGLYVAGKTPKVRSKDNKKKRQGTELLQARGTETLKPLCIILPVSSICLLCHTVEQYSFSTKAVIART